MFIEGPIKEEQEIRKLRLQLDDINANISGVSSQIANIQSQIANMDAKISSIQYQIDETDDEQKRKSLTSQLNEQKKARDSASASLTGLNNQLSSLEKQKSDIESQIAKLEGQVSDIKKERDISKEKYFARQAGMSTDEKLAQLKSQYEMYDTYNVAGIDKDFILSSIKRQSQALMNKKQQELADQKFAELVQQYGPVQDKPKMASLPQSQSLSGQSRATPLPTMLPNPSGTPNRGNMENFPVLLPNPAGGPRRGRMESFPVLLPNPTKRFPSGIVPF